jgi:hypothetical protein
MQHCTAIMMSRSCEGVLVPWTYHHAGFEVLMVVSTKMATFLSLCDYVLFAWVNEQLRDAS